MREILFRGKDVSFGDWIEGDLIRNDSRCYPAVFIGCIEASRNRYNELSVDGHYLPQVAPETVGQYTGLKDKNGKKIFEDDIVKSNIALWGKDKYVVSFEETRGGWYPFACGDGCGCCEEETISTEHVTVIGNIHDNLELAEGAYE